MQTVANKEEFVFKIVNRNQLRIISSDVESYKKIITLVRENGLIGHTFNLKDQRCYRLVIKNLHHTTPHSAIIEEMEITGNKVHGEIINVKYGPEKKPTSTFFVNLVPSPTNSAVKAIRSIHHQTVVIEEPKRKNTIPQCQRCQQYGHSKNYCMRPYRCVKCAQSHKTSDCPKKDRNTPAKCTLCEGAHPANYKGCTVYREILKRKIGNKSTSKVFPRAQHKVSSEKDTPHERPHQIGMDQPNHHVDGDNMQSYAQITKNQPKLDTLLTQQAQKLDKLLDQMSTMMNLLTTVINKLVR